MKLTTHNSQLTTTRGFTVLFAVVVSAIVLSIGLSIANIMLKQITISSAGRESQIAFYTADSGAECAIYADLIGNAFPLTESDGDTVVGPFTCFGGAVPTNPNDESGNSVPVAIETPEGVVTTFKIQYMEDPKYCAVVSVTKVDSESDGFAEKTTIRSRGYNTCDLNNARRLERGIEIRY